MLARWRAAGLVIPAIMTLVMLPVLIALGAWQLERKGWKEDLIARLASGRTAEPVSLNEVWQRYRDGGNIEYVRVRVTGTFDHAGERFVYAPREASQGFDVYTPLKSGDGTVYVLRGWVPDKLKDPAARAEGQLPGPVTVTGLARLPEQAGMFTPADDAAANRWYRRDPAAFAGALKDTVAPFSIDAEVEPANPGGWPKPTPTEIRLSNRHLEYVLTWWGLAATLVVVFALYARQRLAALGRTLGSTTRG
jgi:surfeit locus 1 family protein